MVNGSALYQTLSCRLWGRTALYQSSGAFGFRDQLQDVLAAAPLASRYSLASTSSRRRATSSPRATCCTGGSRTRVGAYARASSTTALWLPFVVAEYLAATGDASVLDEAHAVHRRAAAAPRATRTTT